MNNKLYNKKGLTFKGASVVVIIAHVFGICSLYGYSKYKSHQLKLAREDWKNKIEQRDDIQNVWKTNDMSSRVITKSHWKIPTEVKTNVTPSVLLEKAQKITSDFLSKTNAELNSALKDFNKKEKTQVKFVSSCSTIKKKPDARKTEKFANNPTVTPATDYTIKQHTPVAVQTVLPPKTITVASAPKYQPASKPNTKQIRSQQTRTNPRLLNREEFDYETQETVQTFYSY